MVIRAGAVALLAMTLILTAIVLAARPAGRTSRTATRVLGAIPVASAALGIVAIVAGRPDLLALMLLLSCAAVILMLARVQDRRLRRHMKAAQDHLRRARLKLRQRRRTPPGSSPPAQGGGRPEARSRSR